MRIPFTVLAIAIAIPFTVQSQQVVGRNEAVFTWSDRVARGDLFRFASPVGRVTVTQGSGDRVQVRAEKVLRDGQVSDIGFVVVRQDDGVTVCAVYDDEDRCDRDGVEAAHDSRRRNDRWTQRASLDVTIQVPAGVRIAASSGNGDVSVSGAAAEVTAASGNGAVQVTGSGDAVRASSGNGRVTVTDARGPVTASSGNGDVSVATAQGPVTARSGNGDVIIAMDALRGGGDVEASTGNGRVRVTLPADVGADLDASTGRGDIDSDFPISLTGRLSRTRIRGAIGGGGRRLRLSSGNGSIEIRKR
jgi:hypothetical protein